MPTELLKSYQSLDRALDNLHTKKLFKSDSYRIVFLIENMKNWHLKKKHLQNNDMVF